MSKRFVDVAAGLILTPDGQLLLAQRPGDKPWSGWWELPGGKLEPGETPTQALTRELKEELGIDVIQTTPWVTYTHEYPQTIVRLAFHRVTGWNGEPSGIEGQSLAWTNVYGTPSVSPLLPATKPPLRWLQLPDRYLLTSIGTAGQVEPYLQRLSAALDAGIQLVQFREPAWALRTGKQEQDQLYDAFQRVVALCRQHGAYCLVNSVHPEEWSEQADGIHYRAADAAMLKNVSPGDTSIGGGGSTAETPSKPIDETIDGASGSTVGAGDAASRTMDAASAATQETGATSNQATDKATGVSPGHVIQKVIDMTETANVTEADNHTTIIPLPGAVRGNCYIGVSAHTAEDLQIARQINADFVVLGHVLDTPSHPGTPGMGWERFSDLNRQAGLPVFAIGGQSSESADAATAAGAHGIAGIRFSDDF